MKWRMWPDLNTEMLAGTKCLLLGNNIVIPCNLQLLQIRTMICDADGILVLCVGAGTLGCAVARTLMGKFILPRTHAQDSLQPV